MKNFNQSEEDLEDDMDLINFFISNGQTSTEDLGELYTGSSLFTIMTSSELKQYSYGIVLSTDDERYKGKMFLHDHDKRKSYLLNVTNLETVMYKRVTGGGDYTLISARIDEDLEFTILNKKNHGTHEEESIFINYKEDLYAICNADEGLKLILTKTFH